MFKDRSLVLGDCRLLIIGHFSSWFFLFRLFWWDDSRWLSLSKFIFLFKSWLLKILILLVNFLDCEHFVKTSLTDAFRETRRCLDNIRLLTKLLVVEFRRDWLAWETSLNLSHYHFRLTSKFRFVVLVFTFFTAAWKTILCLLTNKIFLLQI